MYEADQRIRAIRQFNRFITRKVGALQEGLLHSSYSLAEVRVMFELAHRNDLTAAQLTKELGIDAGYLSRILGKFDQRGFINKIRSETDGRKMILQLTEKGMDAYAPLNQRSNEEIAEMLAEIPDADQQRLLEAMQTVERLLTSDFKYAEPFMLRSHFPGDMGWIIYKHGVLYSREYGWDERFEAAVSQIAADFINNYNPEKEHCWIAEMGGDNVGSIVLAQENENTARIRLLIVDPKARGMGVGSRLVEEAVRFAKRKGYQRIVLWTNHVLKEARHIYRSKGFQLVFEEEHNNFGPTLIGETWELQL